MTDQPDPARSALPQPTASQRVANLVMGLHDTNLAEELLAAINALRDEDKATPCVRCGRPASICQGDYDIVYDALIVAMKDVDRRDVQLAGSRALTDAPQPTRFFWVMERPFEGAPAYWDGGHAESFTRKIDHAVQWCRKDDLLKCVGFTKHYAQWGWIPVEHGIMANVPASSLTDALRAQIAEMRSAVQSSKQFGTPVADHQLIRNSLLHARTKE